MNLMVSCCVCRRKCRNGLVRVVDRSEFEGGILGACWSRDGALLAYCRTEGARHVSAVRVHDIRRARTFFFSHAT